ncbi:MAG TPA: hypothetical protein VGF59_01855 [Bryobacteraceae bacterium]|jgi:hypothetical protein
MIAAVKGWYAVASALLYFLPLPATAADDLNGAARELARKTAAFAGRGEPVAATWRNVSSLPQTELAQARRAFEAAIHDLGGRVGSVAPAAEVQITLSQNQSQYLLTAEARKADDRQVWIASWPRPAPAPGNPPSVTLESRQIWEQDEPILDIAFPAAGMLALSPGKVSLYQRQNGAWEPRGAVAILPVRPWPRDLRGRLRVNGTSFQAYLPGMLCSGALDPTLSMDCRASDEAWVIESGSRALLVANFAAARNYFDGRMTTQTGLKKTLPPFYSAASVEEQGRQLWLLATVDGRTQIFDAALDSVGAIAGWGSDIAGTDAHCGGGFQVLATRPGDGSEPDAIQGYSMVNRAATAITAPVEFPGPVTALWTSGGTAAVAVSKNPATGKYAAYLITVACGS